LLGFKLLAGQNPYLPSTERVGEDEQLRKNPGLIKDPKYVNDHPELREFLENHPGVREELKEHPKYFMHREKQFERRERAAGRRRK